MQALITRRTGGSLLTATFLSLVLAGQAAAAGWSAPTALTNSGNAGEGGLVTLGTSTAVAVYRNNSRIVVRRSTSSGGSWSSPVRLSEDGHYPAIAGRGTSVDVVWIQGERIRYARSTNSAASFGASVALSSGTYVDAGVPAVGRGPNGLVAVAWMEANKVPCCDAPWPIRVRVSINGGASFGPATTVGTGWDPVVAVGKGVVYLGYQSIIGSRTGVTIRRSNDAGASWKSSADITTSSYRSFRLSLTAAGSTAYLAYGDRDDNAEDVETSWVRVHRTSDKGMAWTRGKNLTSSALGSQASDPVVSLNGGVARVVYSRPGPTIWYSESPDGKVWSAEQQVTPGSDTPLGVGHASRSIALYAAGGNVFVRTATP